MRRVVLPLVMLACMVAGQERPPLDSREQSRSMVITRHGIVASSQTLASAAGVRILEQGGTAVDAAIAANAVLGVVEPTGNGIGGDLFAIVYEAKTGKLHGLNASGWAPTGLTLEFLKAKGEQSMPKRGIHSVTVPGAVAGWDALHKRFGRLPLKSVLAPAIHYAGQGFPVTEWIALSWSHAASLLSENENARKTYMPDGAVPKAGSIFRNRDLAASLRRIALYGRDGFYRGRTATAMLAASKELGGTFTAADFAEFQAEWVDPISTTYRGWTVTELPPNGQGIAALAMLNIMERFPLGDYEPLGAKSLHIMIEAKKLAYADMLRYVGDPRSGPIPVDQMLSKELAATRAGLIKEGQAACSVTPSELLSMSRTPGADTIYLSVVDRHGNIVSLIQSNYQGFGSGVVPSGTGFMLQNRGALFTLDPGQPNTLAPRKRPLHTIIPGFLSKGDVRIGFGIMGGWNQAQAHAQFVSNIVDHGMNIQMALESPRFSKTTFDGCDLYIESRVPEAARDRLKEMGHEIETVGAFSPGPMGGGQAVMTDANGVKFGASDPRKDGAAIPESPRFVN